jgi:pimeloyl-ACP methyl ester carboxylesterase
VPATLATETIEVLGLRVRRLVRGTGPPVLVLHGWGASIEAVHPIVAGLEAVAAVHALDLPGFGQSEAPPSPWGVEDYQRLVAAYMDTQGVDRATILGHSNGGRIAIRLAATEPERVQRLVLVDSAGIRPKRTFRWYRRVALAKIGKHAARRLGAPGRWLRDALVGRVASTDYAAAGELRPTLVRLVNAQLRPYLPQIPASTLLIWGDRDTDTPLWMGREMERLIPDAGLVILEGAGHFSYLDQPDRFVRIVSHFVAPPAEPDAGARST